MSVSVLGRQPRNCNPLDGLAHGRSRVVHRVAAVVDDDRIHLRRGIWMGFGIRENHDQTRAERARVLFELPLSGS